MNKFRKRYVYIFLSLAVLASFFLLSPSWVEGAIFFQRLLGGMLAICCMHFTRKWLHDDWDISIGEFAKKAFDSAIGAGLVIIGFAILTLAFAIIFSSTLHAKTLSSRSYIPKNAYIYAPALKVEQQYYWTTHPKPELLAGLVETESCVTLTSHRCWSPSSRLKSRREEGAGFGQITRAWNKRGALRLDALADMRRRHHELSGLSWDNVYQRPDLQLRAMVLQSRDYYSAIHLTVADPINALAFADAAYNGGIGGVNAERRICYLTRDCDSQKWFGNVERHCTKSRHALYGRRSACDINIEHVRSVILIRSNKYHGIMS